MSIHEIQEKARAYREYKRLAEEAEAMAAAVADELKQYMADTNQTKAIAGEYKLTYSDCKRESLDKKRLEDDLGDLSGYMNTTYYKRFLVA